MLGVSPLWNLKRVTHVIDRWQGLWPDNKAEDDGPREASFSKTSVDV